MSATTPQQGEGRLLVLHRSYPDPVEDVWAALTESDRLSRWLGTWTGQGGAGSTVEFTWTGEVDAGGEVAPPATVTVHECDPPRRLVVDLPESDDQVWTLEVDLAPDGPGTALTFRQQLGAEWDGGDIEAGWSWYLDKLRAALAGEPMPPWEPPAGTSGD